MVILEAMAEGHGDKTDIGFGIGGGLGGIGGFGGAGVSSYQRTAIGQVVVLAYIDAYTKLVGQMGGLPSAAAQDAPLRTLTMTRPGAMRASPSEKGKGVRQLSIPAWSSIRRATPTACGVKSPTKSTIRVECRMAVWPWRDSRKA